MNMEQGPDHSQESSKEISVDSLQYGDVLVVHTKSGSTYEGFIYRDSATGATAIEITAGKALMGLKGKIINNVIQEGDKLKFMNGEFVSQTSAIASFEVRKNSKFSNPETMDPDKVQRINLRDPRLRAIVEDSSLPADEK